MQLKSLLLLIIPLLLCAFTHLWNPIGFPNIFYDEGIYLGRAMGVLNGLGPHEGERYYDHPYFGEFFLAGIFKIIGYPYFLHLSPDIHSIEMLYLIPRICIGVLAVIDTFLIYMISKRRYDANVAIIASCLFAVMPISWLTRWIVLDSLLLPLLLTSILFALKREDSTNDLKSKNYKALYNRNVQSVLLSGIFLGLAMYTKLPASTALPLVGFLIVTNNKNWKILALWFIPVIVIPSLWPIQAALSGDFGNWLQGVLDQTNRGSPLIYSLNTFFQIDPVMFILGFAGLVYSVIRKDYFLLAWAVPVFIFLQVIGFISPFHLLLLLPPFCIAGGSIICGLVKRIKLNRYKDIVQFAVVSILVIFGLVSTTMLITINVTSAQFQTVAFLLTYIEDVSPKREKIGLVANPIYTRIFDYFYKKDNLSVLYNYPHYDHVKPDKILIIADAHFDKTISKSSQVALKNLYLNSSKIVSFGEWKDKINSDTYPYTNLNEIEEWHSPIEIRVAHVDNNQ